jgi:tape measure domain-containing protein
MSKDLKVTIELDGKASGATKAIQETDRGLRELASAGKGAEVAAAGVDEIGNAAQRAEAKATPAHRKVADGVRSISEQLTEVKTLYAAWIATQQAVGAVSGIAATADAYANLQARLKLVVGDGDALKQAFEGVQQVALSTNSSLAETGNLFAKLAEVGKALGVSQQEALALTETINQAVQLSGASAQASEAALTQLIQGLNGGALRGEEFNSVMEQSPRLARALADGLGKTTGELREMANAGQLSSQVVIDALRGQAQAVEQEFAQLPATIGRAITNLESQWQVFVGSLDESSGASATAAQAIELLAENLDFVAGSLMNAGQAFLAWKAYNIAAEFLSLKTAVAAVAVAKTAETAATVANTAAVSANTAATVANNAAKAGAAVASDAAAGAAGRLAGALSLIKGLSFAFLVTNLVDIGKWLGEAAAKAMGYGKELEKVEMQMRAEEAATKAMAAETAALQQQARLAADAMLGLSESGQAVVAKFDELKKQGKSTAEAISEVGKMLSLSDLSGIQQAGAALDALALRGKLTAKEVQDAWALALKGKDLQQFAVEAMTAFDNTEQSARRLAAAMEARLAEAIRRTGKDFGELSNGVNATAQKAINDFDVLSESLEALGQTGVNVGVTLAASLDQALKAATTEAAVQAVIDRWKALGNQGAVTGQQLADGLTVAQRKLEDIKPGVNSLAEAFRVLGMKSQEELNKTAENARQAFETIKQGSGSTRQEVERVGEAFKRYAEAAIAANGGVASDTMRVEAAMNGYRIEVDAAGKAMLVAADAASAMSGGLREVGKEASLAADDVRRLAEEEDRRRKEAEAEEARKSSGPRVAMVEGAGFFYKPEGQVIREAAEKTGAPLSADQVVEVVRQFESLRSGGAFAGQRNNEAANREIARLIADARRGGQGSQRQSAAPPSQAVQHTVNVSIGGKAKPIKVLSADDADALVGLFRQLESDAARSN